MEVDREIGRAGRAAPRWLDHPQREAFLVSVGTLPPEAAEISWPSWLAPAPGPGGPSSSTSGGRMRAPGKRPKRLTKHDEPRLPPGIPAPTGA